MTKSKTPDIYLSGEKQEYLEYKVPKKFEAFFNKKQIFTVIITITILLIIAQVIST